MSLLGLHLRFAFMADCLIAAAAVLITQQRLVGAAGDGEHATSLLGLPLYVGTRTGAELTLSPHAGLAVALLVLPALVLAGHAAARVAAELVAPRAAAARP